MEVLRLDGVTTATDDGDRAAGRFDDLLGRSSGDRIAASTRTDAGEQPLANRISETGSSS